MPTAVCPNCQVFNPRSLGAKPDFTCFPRSGESLSVFARRGVLLVVSLPSLCATGERHGVPDRLFPALSPHPEPCLGCRGAETFVMPLQAAHPQRPCQRREHRPGVWFFSASQVPALALESAAKDNEPSGISPTGGGGRALGGEFWPYILPLSLTLSRAPP